MKGYGSLLGATLIVCVVALCTYEGLTRAYREESKIPGLTAQLDSIADIPFSLVDRPTKVGRKMSYVYISKYFKGNFSTATIFHHYDHQMAANGWHSAVSLGVTHVYCKDSVIAEVEIYESKNETTRYLISLATGGVDYDYCANPK